MWGLHCTHRGQSQEGQEESGWGVWFHWTDFFLCICSGCCATVYLFPSQETWTFLKHHYQKGNRLSSYSLLPVMPASVQQGIFSSVWGRCYAVNIPALGCKGFLPSFPGSQNTYWNLDISLWKLRNFEIFSKTSWEVFLPGKWNCHKDLSQTKNGCCLGAFVLVGLLLFGSVGF